MERGGSVLRLKTNEFWKAGEISGILEVGPGENTSDYWDVRRRKIYPGITRKGRGTYMRDINWTYIFLEE